MGKVHCSLGLESVGCSGGQALLHIFLLFVTLLCGTFSLAEFGTCVVTNLSD